MKERSATREIRLEGVTVAFAARSVLRSVELRVSPGEALALTGPSGSGKSTLCLVLAGVLAPSRGRALLGGRDLASAEPGEVGFIPQSHALVSGLTAAETVALPLQARGVARAGTASRTSSALEAVGLFSHADRLVDRLSGGERQRVAIARALAGSPFVLVADEPTAELDPENREKVMALFRSLVEEGCTLVLATDDDEVLRRFARAVQLEDGMVTEDLAAS